jgi:hypothetical protein
MTAAPAKPARPEHDFDFLHGAWDVSHRRLKSYLAQDSEWMIFSGKVQARPILDGIGNFDENLLHRPDGSYQACTLRFYNKERDQWSIYWIDGRSPGLDTGVHGSFENGIGTFYGDDQFNGTPIRIRFIWSKITADSCQWEQAFSTDGGMTWETNWVMSFVRTQC